jgi:outer membrane protein W
MNNYILLSALLVFTLATKVEAQVITEELTYEQLLQRVSAQKKVMGTTSAKAAPQANTGNQASFSFFTGWLNLSANQKTNITANTQGLEVGWLSSLGLAKDFNSYYSYRNYGLSPSSAMTGHEVQAQVQKQFGISETFKAQVGGGFAIRSTNYSSPTLNLTSFAPLVALQTGLDYRANADWTLSTIISARSLFLAESNDKNSLDLGFKAATRF